MSTHISAPTHMCRQCGGILYEHELGTWKWHQGLGYYFICVKHEKSIKQSVQRRENVVQHYIIHSHNMQFQSISKLANTTDLIVIGNFQGMEYASGEALWYRNRGLDRMVQLQWWLLVWPR
jgi:hypothetical protein